jgi:hypothetical protein
VHLTLTCEWANYTWRPLTQADSLLDSSGRMHRTVAALMEHATADDIRAECRAQLALALRRGLPVNYVDVHMCIPTIEARDGQLYVANPGHELALMRIVEAVGREFGLEYPYALDGDHLRHFRSALSISGKGRAAVEHFIDTLEPGWHHLSCHCAADAAGQDALSPEDSPEYPWSLQYRLEDYSTITAAWFAELLRRRGVELARMPWSRHAQFSRAQA